MKTLTVTIAALFAALAARSEGFDGATFRTNGWFGASMSGVEVGAPIAQGSATGVTSGAGSWTAVPSDGTATNAADGASRFLSLDACGEMLTFAPSPFAVTSGYETATAKIRADAAEAAPAVDADAQAAFTVVLVGDALQAIGHTGAGWTNLVCSCAADLTNGWFTVYVDFANEGESRYVRYSVEPEGGALEVLQDSQGASWFPTAQSPAVNTISFTGIGGVQSFSGDELTVPVTFGEPEITYLASYQSATTVVAAVSGTVAADTAFSMTFDGVEYGGVYDGESGNVTFYNVGGSLAVGETPSYSIGASSANGCTGGESVARTATVGTVTDGWIAEDAAHRGSGTWTTNGVAIAGLDYADSAAALKGHMFTPTNSVNGAVVTVRTKVCFNDLADPEAEMAGGTYAAVKIDRLSGEDPAPVFKVYAKESADGAAAWIPVFGEAGGEIDAENVVYDLAVSLDFNERACSFAVGECALTNSAGASEFRFATDGRRMKAISFGGTAEFTSLAGSYVAADGIEVEVGEGRFVEIDRTWVADNLSSKTVDEARTLLATNSTVTTAHGGSTYNYFECYALGLNPEDPSEAPVIVGTPGEGGKMDMSLSGVKVPAGVTLTATLKKSASPDTGFAGDQAFTVVGTDDGATATGAIAFDPAQDMDGGKVKYMKMEIAIEKTAP